MIIDPTTLRWARFVTGLIACALGVVILSGITILAILRFQGYDVSLVTSGSMSPVLHSGDVIAAKPLAVAPADLGTGTIIRFDNGSGPTVHRIIGRTQGSYLTRGDAVGRVDTDPVHPDQVLGIPQLVVPFIGIPLLWVREGTLIPLLFVLLGLLMIVELAKWGFGRQYEPWTASRIAGD